MLRVLSVALTLLGDGFMMFASCYHGGGANKTKDEERLLYSCFMTRGWLRQEENHYLNMSLDKVKTLPTAIQDICGYTLSEPFLGWVNSTTPRVVLDPSIKVSATTRVRLKIRLIETREAKTWFRLLRQHDIESSSQYVPLAEKIVNRNYLSIVKCCLI